MSEQEEREAEIRRLQRILRGQGKPGEREQLRAELMRIALKEAPEDESDSESVRLTVEILVQRILLGPGGFERVYEIIASVIREQRLH